MLSFRKKTFVVERGIGELNQLAFLTPPFLGGFSAEACELIKSCT
jgi:hypothetical protein